MKPEKLVGKLVRIIDKDSDYYNHWGYIRHWDGDVYHVSGGSIASSYGEVTPIFSREQFRIPRDYERYIKLGAKFGQSGREITERQEDLK